MKIEHLLLVAGIVLATLANNSARAQAVAGTSPRYVEGELLVKFKGGPRGDAATRAKNTMKHEVKRHFDFIGWQQIKLPAGMTVEEGLPRYRKLPDVLDVEPNGLAQLIKPLGLGSSFLAEKSAAAVTPNDPMLGQQWALEKVGAPLAWGVTNGSSDIVVAVLDTGINYLHEDLRGNMWHNPGEIPGNGIDDDGNGYIDDIYGIDTADDAFGNDSDPLDKGANGFYHGSACAGIIGASGHNGTGIAGIILTCNQYNTN